jgi:hypothetical protein
MTNNRFMHYFDKCLAVNWIATNHQQGGLDENLDSLPSGYKSNKINWLLKSPKSFSEFDV